MVLDIFLKSHELVFVDQIIELNVERYIIYVHLDVPGLLLVYYYIPMHILIIHHITRYGVEKQVCNWIENGLSVSVVVCTS